jgi:hypothetical protein
MTAASEDGLTEIRNFVEVGRLGDGVGMFQPEASEVLVGASTAGGSGKIGGA